MSNIDGAKIFFGLVLNKLHDCFPAPLHLTDDHIWPDFKDLAGDKQIVLSNQRKDVRKMSVSEAFEIRNARIEYSRRMLEWMKLEGFIHSDTVVGFPFDYVLSAKSLALLDEPIVDTGETLGFKLRKAVQQAGSTAAASVIERVVETLLERLL